MFLAALLQVGKAGTRGVERLGKSGVHHVQGIAASITQAVLGPKLLLPMGCVKLGN